MAVADSLNAPFSLGGFGRDGGIGVAALATSLSTFTSSSASPVASAATSTVLAVASVATFSAVAAFSALATFLVYWGPGLLSFVSLMLSLAVMVIDVSAFLSATVSTTISTVLTGCAVFTVFTRLLVLAVFTRFTRFTGLAGSTRLAMVLSLNLTLTFTFTTFGFAVVVSPSVSLSSGLSVCSFSTFGFGSVLLLLIFVIAFTFTFALTVGLVTSVPVSPASVSLAGCLELGSGRAVLLDFISLKGFLVAVMVFVCWGSGGKDNLEASHLSLDGKLVQLLVLFLRLVLVNKLLGADG